LGKNYQSWEKFSKLGLNLTKNLKIPSMKQVVVKFSELDGELKEGVQEYLKSHPEKIGFPYKGRHTEGYFYEWEGINYLIIDNFYQANSVPDNFEDEVEEYVPGEDEFDAGEEMW
jgi:hypothetical protein